MIPGECFTIYDRVILSVMSEELRQHGCEPRFVMSDSKAVALSLPGISVYIHNPDRGYCVYRHNRTGSDRQNTSRVREAVLHQDQASSLLKADGAGSMTPKRSRQFVDDYFRVRRGLS